jgi:hypothetical protein
MYMGPNFLNSFSASATATIMGRRKAPPPIVAIVPLPHSFPTEIEREVFEIAAFLHPKMIPKMLCVARRLLLWCMDSL